MMYLLEPINKTTDGKNEYHFKVLAIHRKDQETTEDFKHNAKTVLKNVKEEYYRVKTVLNKNRIYFDSYCAMEEGKDKQACI